MAPPPGPPPGAPQPYYYPPPPPPAKSGTMKWILIGCTIVGGLGLLCCGGGGLWFYVMMADMKQHLQTAETEIRSSKIVERELGAVKKVTPHGQRQQPGSQDFEMVLRVEGEKKNGDVTLMLRFSGFTFTRSSMSLEVDGSTEQIPLDDAASK